MAIDQASEQQHWAVGRVGTITAADVIIDGRALFTAVSVYAAWDRTPSGGIYADAAAHRILSDLSVLMFTRKHRLVISGDSNILFGHGEHGDAYFADRYRTVFDRAAALGLRFVGPQGPNGRQADPWPEELPTTWQLDFVFAWQSPRSVGCGT